MLTAANAERQNAHVMCFFCFFLTNVGIQDHFFGVHLEQVWEGMGVLRDPGLQTVEVQTEETQQLMRQEVVIEQLGRETAKNQLPHDVTVHRSDLTWWGSSTVSA